MTQDAIPLEDLPAPTEARRDQYGRYKIVPPAGGKPLGYTRVTTVAKTLDSGGGLATWKATMTAVGMTMRRGLRSRWEALVAEHGDPWYAGADAKKACRQLVEDCAAVGGADDRRAVGSSLHSITALVDLGKKPQHLTEETERDVQAYIDGLAEAGITIVPGQVELCVVLDTFQVAGTLDRLAIVPGFDLPLIADLKTGANLEYSWSSIAVQLAAYSRGEALYQQGAAKDGSQDVRLPMPAVNQDWGLIFWLNVDEHGSAKLELYLVDLNAGWQGFLASLWTRDWRKQDPQRSLFDMTPLPPAEDGNIAPALEASVAVTKARKSRKAKKEPPAPEPLTKVIGDYQASELDGLVENYRTELRAWLQRRIDVIGEHETARPTLTNAWPKNIPSLRVSDAHTFGELDVIERLLDDIERAHTVSFPTARPVAPEMDEHDQAVARVINLFDGTTQQPAKDT